MAYFAPKIFSNDSLLLQQEVLNILSENEGLEIALYGYNKFNPFITEQIKNIPSHKKIIHLWQKRVYLLGLINKIDLVKESFLWEVEQFKELGVFKAVIHNNKADTPLKATDIKKFIKKSINGIELAQKYGIQLHIENTFESLSFFEQLFEEYDKQNIIDKVGFCLDTGHARLYSNTDWLFVICG